MLHDVVVVGAGPVGSTLALALADGDLDVVVLDARAAGETPRGDRSLALSHGARLILERLGVWGALAATPGAVTPITRIDISQAGRLRQTQLDGGRARPAGARLRRQLSRAAGGARRGARARAVSTMRHGVTVTAVGGTPAYAAVERRRARRRAAARASRRGGRRHRRRGRRHRAAAARLRPGRARRQGLARDAARGLAPSSASRRDGPIALLPEGDHYGLVWTATPDRAQRVAGAADDAAFLDALARHFGAARRRLHARRRSPHVSARAGVRARAVRARAASRSAMRRRRCIRSPGRASTSGCATRASSRRSSSTRRARASASARCSSAIRAAGAPIGWRASRSRTASSACSATIFRSFAGRAGWRSLCSTPFPPAKRAFTRAMLFGIALIARAAFACRSKKRATCRDARTREKVARASLTHAFAERL